MYHDVIVQRKEGLLLRGTLNKEMIDPNNTEYSTSVVISYKQRTS